MSSKTLNNTKGEQLTILRIKRKRTEEPLDALLVHQENEKRIKKSNDKQKNALSVSATALPTLFRLAETVEQKSFSNLDEAKKLKDRISRRIQPGTSRPQTPTSIEDRKDRLVKEQKDASHKARYRVIQQNRSKVDEDTPPVVQSSSEKAAKDLFQMYEAVKDEDTSKQAKLFVDDDIEDPDDIMCNFIPMVKEYLTLQEKEEEKEDDYVYDVYYRDDENLEQGMNSMNIGSLVWFDEQSEYLDDDTDSELGDNVDEDSNAEDYYQNDYPEEEDSDEFEDQHDYDLSSDDEDYVL
ncbi:solute carrier family 7, member 6 opposite strand [Mucor ambiguus]|uniref:Probable RNA polymerase II nuclear localization protein SLC7A6OS n=1 Tax=Mucor ambiguus TaxID=91626 RepID=A0A0C9MEG4_9FUNG|nr:solute carrier family 7, member 6 opposite strand [Mucor ambiguus]